MAEVLIQDLDPVVLEKLEALAKKHGRRREAACRQTSLQAQLKSILEAAVQAETPKASKTPEELGWSPGFFERTAGCFEDEPLVRYPQGEPEERNWNDLSTGY
jgi:plasmid stability protein